MSIKYLFIDDQEDKAKGMAMGLSSPQSGISVEFSKAQSWNEQIEFIKKKRPEIQGILLDLQLRFPSDTMKYDAPALAQQLRNLVKEESFTDLPILLCSTDDKMQASFDKNTNDDLFDKFYDKNKWVLPDAYKNSREEMIDLAKGYQEIINETSLKNLLKCEEQPLLALIEDKLIDVSTPHSKASFVLKQLVLQSGLLVDEDLLAIRLGIDKDNSPDWGKVKKALLSFQYKGIFGQAWQRWWIGAVMQWWRSISDNSSLSSMTAQEKITLLTSKVKYKQLKVVNLAKHHQDTKFWYQCKYSNIPLSYQDAFLLKGQDTKLEWQDKEFVSKNFLLENKNTERQKEAIANISYLDIEKVKFLVSKK